MRHHEIPNKQEIDPRLLDFHRREMHKTRQEIAPFYRDAKMGHIALNERKHFSVNNARNLFADSAEQFLKEKNPRDPNTRIYAQIFAVIPLMMDGLKVLRGRGTSQHERYKAKMKLIKFDDVLRTIIDSDPSIPQNTIISLIHSAMHSYGYSAEELNMAAGETEAVLHGMKHELAFASTLYHLPEGYEVLDTTDEDDKHAADFKVRCPNGVILYIDVKATAKAAERATWDQEDYYTDTGRKGQMPKNELILYSGFTDDDFTEKMPWRATPEATQRVYPDVEAVLHRASIEYLEQIQQGHSGKIRVGQRHD
jgi:hypothetical protein